MNKATVCYYFIIRPIIIYVMHWILVLKIQ